MDKLISIGIIIMSFTSSPCLIPPIRMIGVIVRATLTTKYPLIDLSKPVAWNAILLLQNRIYISGLIATKSYMGQIAKDAMALLPIMLNFIQHTPERSRENLLSILLR